MKTLNHGFTLLELLVVIAIIGILSAIAIPYYQRYIIKAKLVEVERAMAEVKDAVSAYRQEKGDFWPDCPSMNDIRNSLGIGLAAVSRVSSLSVDSSTGVITATIDNVHTTVNGKTITLTPILNADGSFSWEWGWSADFPENLGPKSKKEKEKEKGKGEK